MVVVTDYKVNNNVENKVHMASYGGVMINIWLNSLREYHGRISFGVNKIMITSYHNVIETAYSCQRYTNYYYIYCVLVSNLYL